MVWEWSIAAEGSETRTGVSSSQKAARAAIREYIRTLPDKKKEP